MLIAAAVLAAARSLPADVIITEVADGTLTGQQPKFVEITNVGTAAYTFPEGGGIIVQNNANTDYDVDWPLGGVTLAPGQSWVVNSLTPDGAEAATFVLLFGMDADQYADVPFGNGDDRYILTDGSNFLDIFGEDGVDATPEGNSGPAAVWTYFDGYAYRNPGITAGRGLEFDPSEWVFGGPDSLEADTEAQQIILAQTLLSPGFYESGIDPTPTWAGYPVDDQGKVDTLGWLALLNVATAPWVWNYSLQGWIYLPEDHVSESGAWTFIPRH
jgi:hypothetical protein